MLTKPLALLLTLTLLSACTTVHTQKKIHRMAITTTPPKAQVWRENKEGRQAVGMSPLVVEEVWEERKRKVHPVGWAVMAALAVVALAGAVLIGDSEEGSRAAGIGMAAGAGGLLLYSVFALTAMPWDLTENISLKIGASSPGYDDAWLERVLPESLKKKGLKGDPTHEKVHLALGKAGGSKIPTAATRPVAPEPKRSIVAVFEPEDPDNKLASTLSSQLAEYFATQLTSTGKFRTIPRAQMRRRLGGEKKKGYKACFDEACQIELGRSLAAQKSLATKIIRVGKLCTLTSVLYDLKTETSERAATSTGPCTVEGLLESLRRQALKLAKSMR